jgi:hypothetical protein
VKFFFYTNNIVTSQQESHCKKASKHPTIAYNINVTKVLQGLQQATKRVRRKILVKKGLQTLLFSQGEKKMTVFYTNLYT